MRPADRLRGGPPRAGLATAFLLAGLAAGPLAGVAPTARAAGTGAGQSESGSSSVPIGDPGRLVFFAPELRLGLARSLFRAAGVVQGAEDAETMGDGRLSALHWRSVLGEVRAVAALDAGTRSWPGLGRTSRVQGFGALRIGEGRWGAWAGAGKARSRSGGRGLTSDVFPAGLSVRIGGARVSLTSQSNLYVAEFTSVDTLVIGPPDSIPPIVRISERSERRSYTDANLEVGWGLGRLGLDAGVGYRIGPRVDGPRATARLAGSFDLTPRVALVAEGGRLPSVPEQGLPSHGFASLSLRFDLADPVSRALSGHGIANLPDPPRFTVRSVDGDRRRIRVRAPGANAVDLAGDFTDWAPFSMWPTGSGWWEAVCAVPPGPHRLNIRIDGGPWIVPPDLESVEDEFNGKVGVIVAP